MVSRNLNNIFPQTAYYCFTESFSSQQTVITIQTSAVSNNAMELVMDYMQKRIDQIDETRRKFKAQYPDLLPESA